LFAVVVVVLVTAFNDWSKDKQFRNLQSKLESEHRINVLRDQRIQHVAVRELLVGDVVLLNYGNVVPADGILLEASDLKIDEAVLTGESDSVKKDQYDIVYSSKPFWLFC
jgi:Ca2+ transporting ATPase